MIKRFFTILAIAFFPIASTAEVPIQQVQSQSGLSAWLVEERSIPFIALEIMFQGGAAADPQGKKGAANLMMGLLEEGAGDLDAQGFQAAQEALAASFGFDVYDETTTISARFLTQNKDEAVELLRLAITQPRFDQAALDRVRAQVLAGIASREKDPDTIAGRAFNAAAFGDHPYALPLEGTTGTVQSLTRDDMIAAHARLFGRRNIHIAAVGDISADELAGMIDTLFADLPEGEALETPSVALELTGGTTVIDFPVPQSVAIFGHAGIDRDDPDFFAAFVLNHILGGGGFESRLLQEVREKRGLTYGIGSYLANRDQAQLYMGQVSSANDRIAQTIDVVKDVWRDTATNGVTAEELEAAKTYLTGAYPLRFDGNARIAGILVGMQRQGLPLDYIKTRNDKVNAVTLEDVNRVAAYLLNPDDLRFVVVGQPEGL
ncbi:MAG: M16 family metallopeptidase [Planktomarina sp.]